MRIRPFVFVFALAGLVLVTSCSNSRRLTHSSPEQAYQKGLDLFEEENYDQAMRYFRAVFQYGRGNEWADDAQYRLAEAYREQGRYLLAANEFQRFTELYRGNQRVPQAAYQRGLMYYKLSPNYNLDQTDTQEAISIFQLFLERYPNHELAPDAQEKVGELRNKLAHKKYDAARLYEKREMWEAAVETYTGLFDSYPDTDWADDALLGAIRGYIAYADASIQKKQDDRYQKAIDNYERLTQLFPESPLLKTAESLYTEARSKLERERNEQAEQESQSLASDDGTS
jgi:outer membrane protein assembly factor BamD